MSSLVDDELDDLLGDLELDDDETGDAGGGSGLAPARQPVPQDSTDDLLAALDSSDESDGDVPVVNVNKKEGLTTKEAPTHDAFACWM